MSNQSIAGFSSQMTIEAQLQLLVGMMGFPDQNMWAIKPCGEIIFSNKAHAESLFNCSVEELIGTNGYRRLLDAGLNSRHLEIIKQNDQLVFRSNRTVVLEECALSFGKEVWFKSFKKRVEIDQEKVMIGCSYRITELKQLQRLALQSRENAMRSSEAKTRFIQNMRHDLKTPLANITGIAMLLERQEQSESNKKFLKHLRDSSEHLSELMSHLIHYAEFRDLTKPVDLKPLRVDRLIDQVVAMHKIDVDKKKLSLVVTIDSIVSQKEMVTDELRVKRVLSNLLSNAVKYTSKGTISLTATHDTSSDSGDTFLKISIQDTGMGIKDGMIDEIFQPMTRAVASEKFSEHGLGLGLDIVKQLLNDVNGTISVSSEYGKGSCFTVLLPVNTLSSQVLKYAP